MNKIVTSILVFVITTLFVVVNAGLVSAAPRLTLTPASGTYANGDTFTVTVGVNSDTSKSNAVDIWGIFDSSKLEVVSVVKATTPAYAFDFSNSPAIDNTTGTFRFSCPSTNLNSFDTAVINGDLAVVTLKAKAYGTATVRFDCTDGSTTDSNIFSDLNDVVTCSANGSGSYTITGGSSSLPTPTTVVTPQLPQTGGVATTIGLVVFGAVSLISALFLKFL